MTNQIPIFRRSISPTAFTLIEVMISLAIVVLLILAISNIFSQASKTVGAGFAVSNSLRVHKSIGQSLRNDIEGYPEIIPSTPPPGMIAGADAPFLVISGSRVTAFASAADRNTDIDGNPDTLDVDGSGDTFPVRPAVYGQRSYRTDQLTFFSAGTFLRQTGNTPEFVGNVQSLTLAMIGWGHVTLPGTVANTYWGPGEALSTTNLDQFYANQFSLGRNAVLLSQPVGTITVPTPERVYDVKGAQQDAFVWPRPTPTPGATDPLTPLVWNSPAWSAVLLQSSRYDLAELDPTGSPDLSDYRARVQAKAADAASTATWWQDLMGIPGHRFQAAISTGPTVNSDTLSRTTPIIARGVTQFIVEFAGDYVTQPTPGSSAVTVGGGPDGTIDYYVRGTVQGIKWYGLPRDVDGNGLIDGAAGAVGSPDVVPVRDMASGQQSFEKLPLPTSAADYAVSMLATETYKCVWGPDEMVEVIGTSPGRPKLIRVIVTVTDEQNRLPDGVTQEYVFRVK